VPQDAFIPARQLRGSANTLSKRNVYTIENVNAAGKYMNVNGWGVPWWWNGRNIHLWDDPQNANTQWRIAEIEKGIYTVESVGAAGKYVEVEGPSRKNGANIWLWDSGPHYAQTQWRIARIAGSTYTLENVYAAGKYMSVADGHRDNGANIQLSDDPQSEKTQWRIVEA